jgi:RNA polymerase sigma-70 factor, ECF subfamily
MNLDAHRPEQAPVTSYVSPSSEASFDSFFVAEYRRVVGITSVLCGSRAEGEELAQEAFVAAFRRWSRISAYDDPAAWVRRVATNLATSSLRRRLREVKTLARMAPRREEDTSLFAEDPEFWESVRALPPRQAQVIALRYLEDRSVAEIAHVLGISEATVRVHLHTAKSRLAVALRNPLADDRAASGDDGPHDSRADDNEKEQP